MLIIRAEKERKYLEQKIRELSRKMHSEMMQSKQPKVGRGQRKRDKVTIRDSVCWLGQEKKKISSAKLTPGKSQKRGKENTDSE